MSNKNSELINPDNSNHRDKGVLTFLLLSQKANAQKVHPNPFVFSLSLLLAAVFLAFFFSTKLSMVQNVGNVQSEMKPLIA